MDDYPTPAPRPGRGWPTPPPPRVVISPRVNAIGPELGRSGLAYVCSTFPNGVEVAMQVTGCLL